MKRFLMLLCLFGCLHLSSHAMPPVDDECQDVDLSVSYHDPTDINNNYPRSPIRIPEARLQAHTLLINGIGGDYTLQLETDDGVAYSITVEGDTGNDTVILPSSLSGTYMLCLYVGNFCFYGTINL